MALLTGESIIIIIMIMSRNLGFVWFVLSIPNDLASLRECPRCAVQYRPPIDRCMYAWVCRLIFWRVQDWKNKWINSKFRKKHNFHTSIENHDVIIKVARVRSHWKLFSIFEKTSLFILSSCFHTYTACILWHLICKQSVEEK